MVTSFPLGQGNLVGAHAWC